MVRSTVLLKWKENALINNNRLRQNAEFEITSHKYTNDKINCCSKFFTPET